MVAYDEGCADVLDGSKAAGSDAWPRVNIPNLLRPRALRLARQFQVSNNWYTTPVELARAIAAVEHWPGWTQHYRLLRYAVAEAEKDSVQELCESRSH